MVLIVNTTSDTAVTEEIKKRASAKGLEPEVIEASGLRINHCIGCNYEIMPVHLRIMLRIVFRTIGRVMFSRISRNWGCTKPLDYRPYQ